MRKIYYIWLLRGMGIGLICSGIIFFAWRGSLEKSLESSLDDQEIMKRAYELGMIPITDMDKVYLTDEEVLQKAEELGMVFPEE